jgi:hypothetical protein
MLFSTPYRQCPRFSQCKGQSKLELSLHLMEEGEGIEDGRLHSGLPTKGERLPANQKVFLDADAPGQTRRRAPVARMRIGADYRA